MGGSIAITILCVIAIAVYAIALHVPPEYRDIAFFAGGWLAKGVDTAFGNWLERQ